MTQFISKLKHRSFLAPEIVIALLGQCYPGTPKYPNSDLDGFKAREKYFHKALLQVARIQDLESVAIPFGIGCGAAGGNWDHYLGIIQNFEKYVKEKQNTKVVIYKL